MAATVSLVLAATFSVAGQLDDHYLQGYGEPGSGALQKAILMQQPATVETPHCGTPLKHDLQRDWNKLEPATQKTLAKQLAAPVLSGPESTLLSASGRYLIHYTITGLDAPPLADVNLNTIPDWVETVAQTFEDVATTYTALGWRLAPTVAGAPYDVYLRNLGPQQLYGQTTSVQPLPAPGFANAFSSFIEVDNDYLDPVYQNALGGPLTTTQKALQSLQITAAHEYHHAIQYGYNFFFDVWYAEATSTWQEDELYDGVNQLYNYLPAWFNNSTLSLDIPADITTGGGYGRWIANRYLAEQHGTIIIRSIWEKLATLNSPGSNADIPMLPVIDGVVSNTFLGSSQSDYFGLVKRIYTRNWSSHTSDISRIHPYTPLAIFSLYPVNGASAPQTSTITLPHTSFAFYRFTPSSTVANLTITIAKTSGIQTALFRNSGGIISEITAAANGSYTVSGFGLLNPASDEVVLLLANTTAIDGHMANFSSDGSSLPVSEPGTTPTQPTTPPPAAAGGGGGGGCFIATAAYGSYLHPQVQILRDFRDTWLLTNAPGRTFVALYYRLSPPLAGFIAQHAILRLLVRLMLTPIVLAIAHPTAAALLLLAAACGMAGRVRLRKTVSVVHPDHAV
jgi:hypothetical protein